MKKAYIFCRHDLPTGHPNGVRLANIGLILRDLGYQVSLYGTASLEQTQITEYKGLHCTVFPHYVGSGLSSRKMRDRKDRERFEAVLAQEGTPDLIITAMYNCEPLRMLMGYCKKNRIPMVKSSCEWFDRSAFSGLGGALDFLNNRYSLCWQNLRIGKLIVISRLLEDYYRKRGCQTVYLPTLIDPDEYVGLSHKENDRLVVAYAGSPAKKDYIANAIRAVGLLSEQQRQRFALHLYGMTERQLEKLGIPQTYLQENRCSIVCHGRIPYEQVKQKISDADFTVLLRPDKRYANAGFPTKVGESMACGTPVIANLTSDLAEYILDGKTGLVCADETPEACAEAFARALSMTAGEREAMRIAAKQRAAGGFYNGVYLEAMEAFLKTMEDKRK